MAQDLLLPDDAPAPVPATPGVPPVLQLPDEPTGLEQVYQRVRSRGIAPEESAKVFDLSRRLNEPEAFVAKNMPRLEGVKKAPGSGLFRELERDYPGVTGFLSTPENMAAIHDDLENLRDHEGAVREYGFFQTMYRSLNSGLASLNASLARVPAAVYDAALIPYNLTLEMQGGDVARRFGLRSPDALINNPIARYYDAQAVASAVPEMETGIVESVGRGEYAKAGRALAAQFVANAPNQAAIIAATLSGYGGAALVGAGAVQAAGVNKRGRDVGAPPGAGAVNAVAQGTIEAAFERLGTFGILKQWEAALAKSFGKKATREVMKDLGRTLAHSVAGEANEEFWTQGAQDLSDYLTGVNPDALKGIENRMVNAGIVGGASGGVLTFGGAVMGGQLQARQNEVRAAERAKEFYVALGEKSEASKLRERLPEQHRALIQRLTENGPVESVFVSREAIDKHFKAQGIEPTDAMAQVGASESYIEAKETGGLVKIPTAQMTALIEDGHYAALADDIKFDAEGFTVNEAKARAEGIRQEIEQLQSGMKDAIADDAQAQEAFDRVYQDTRERLAAVARPEGISEQEWPQVIEDSAQLAAARVVSEAKKRGVPVEDYYKEVRPEIVGGEAATALAEEAATALAEEAARGTVEAPQLDAQSGPAVPAASASQPTGETPQGQPESGSEKREPGRELFPKASSPLPESITAHPDFVKVTDDAAAIVKKYATERGVEPTAEFTSSLFKELHDAFGEVRAGGTPQERMERAKRISAKYPDIGNEFLTLKTKLWTDAVPEYFDLNVKGQYGLTRPKVALDAEAAAKEQEQKNLFGQDGKPHAEAIVEPELRDAVSETAAPEAPAPAQPKEPGAQQRERAAKGLTDVGDELWANRRSLGGKGITWDDVKDLNETLKSREVQKARVWPRPDYEQLVADGLHPFTAHLVKQIYDALPAKPAVRGVPSDGEMRLFIEEVRRAREAVFAWAREVEKLRSSEPLPGGGRNGIDWPFVKRTADRPGVATLLFTRDIDEAAGRLIDRIYPADGPSSHRRLYDNEAYRESARILGNKFIRAIQPDTLAERAAAKAIKEGWPKPQEAWQKRYSIRELPAGTHMRRGGEDVVLKEPEFIITKRAGGGRQIVELGFKTREEAIAKAKELVEVKKKSGQGEIPLDIAMVRRQGPVRRPDGLDVQPKDLQSQFGFRGVNYGNWTNQTERQLFTNHAYDALADLADLLGIPAKALSLDGLIGLAFGAQGRGGKFAAHFVPGVNEINLTKTQGAGALAHEWGHALDHYFAVQAGEKLAKSQDPFLTHHIDEKGDLKGIRPEIAKAFRQIVESMKERVETPEETAKRVEARTAQAVRRLDSWLGHFRKLLEARAKDGQKAAALQEFDGIAERMREGELGEGYEKLGSSGFGGVSQAAGEVRRLFKDATGHVPSGDELKALDANAQHVRFIKSAKAQAEAHQAQGVDTLFLGEAKKLDGGKGGKAYWTQPTELFARAFQSYVLDKLAERAQRSDYLTRPQAKAEKYAFGDPYPRGVERKKINAAFDDLVSNLKTRETERGVALYQGGKEKPRGLFVPSKNMIALLKNADPSTFLHEAAHTWLRDTFEFVKSGKANESYLADWAVMKDFLGVKDGQEKLTEVQQERFAQAFEVYLYEAEAPSAGLKGVFARVRQWMTKVYGDVKARLGVEISPEVRGVFDRMLATEEEIAAARGEVGYGPMKLDGLDPQIAKRLESLERQARAAAEDILLKPIMSEMTKAAKDALDAKRTAYEADARKAFSEQPLYRAAEDLREHVGNAREERQAFGHDLTAQTIAKRFLAGKAGPKTTTYMETMAELYGFTNGKDLAQKLSDAKPFEEAIAESVKDYMAQFEQVDREALREKARQAIHSDEAKHLEYMALEREALASLLDKAQRGLEANQRRRESAALDFAAARQYAQETLGRKPLKEARSFRPYITAERNSAIKARRAAAAGDLEGAYKAKREQMLNHALYNEAVRLNDQIVSDQRFLERYALRGANLLDMPYGFAHQIDELLSRWGMGAPRGDERKVFLQIAKEMQAKGEESADIANATGYRIDENGKLVPETLPDLMARINDDYISVSIPEAVMTTGYKLSSDLTPNDLRDLRAAVQAISDTGKKFSRFLSAFLKGDIREAAAELRAWIEAKVGTPYGDRLMVGSATNSVLKAKLDKLLSLPDAIIPDMVNLLTLVTYLDGGADGPAHKYIYRPLKMAEDRKLSRYEKMTEDINGIFKRHFHPDTLAKMKDERFFFDFIGQTGRYLSREEILAIALNWGNEGNRDRIRRGFRLDDVQVEMILANLDHENWKFVQEVWDHLNTYWPEIVKLETLVSGVQPKAVEPAPILTRYGAFRGGYYPIAYDFERSEDANRHAQDKNALYKQYSTAAAHTDRGHTQARFSQVNRPVRLSLDVLFNHLENVVHDLEFRAAIIDVSRFLKMMDAKSSITNAVGVPGMRSTVETLKAVASDQGEYLSTAEKAIRWFRFRSTFATLAYRAFALPLDLTGNAINAVWEIGPTRFREAIKAFALDAKGTVAFVNEKSERMRARAKVRDRDLMELARSVRGEQSAFTQYGYMVQALADEAISYPLWAQVYRHELGKHGDEVKSVQMADEAVVRTVGSGSVLDQVGAQRGSEAKKILSMYYTWASMMFNRVWLETRGGARQTAMGTISKAEYAGVLAKTTLFAWVLHGLSENFWREMFRNTGDRDEDEEKKWKRVGARLAQQPFGYVWVVRDIAGFTIDKALGKQANYRFSPTEQAIESILTTVAKGGARGAHKAGEVMGLDLPFGERELDEKYIEEATRAGSFMAGFPLAGNAVVWNFIDWINDKGDLTWRDALSRRAKK